MGPSKWSMFDFQKRFWRVAIDIPLDGTLNIDPGTYFPGANGDLFLTPRRFACCGGM